VVTKKGGATVSNHALEAVKRRSEKQKRQRNNWKRRAVAYEQAIRETLADNGHLADGEDCTLIKLKLVLSANNVLSVSGEREKTNDN
jgi:hypothetical protein